ncbi:MAG: patatin-like phospholipase family protein [Bacteroidota bacterium]
MTDTDSTGTAPGARSTVGLALAGGGPEGAIYEIGALRALEEAIEGIDFADVPIYVGVSAGAFVGACLANGISTAQLCRSVVHDEPGEHPFRPDLFMVPAYGELARRSISVPVHVVEGLADWLFKHDFEGGVVAALMGRLGRALPVGLFSNTGIRDYLRKVFSIKGRTTDFRKLRGHLTIVASDLNSGESVRFGEQGLDHIDIAEAVQASTALPVVYPPVTIEGREYVDGVLLKTVHASVALEAGADLVLCVNPIVPVDTARAVEQGIMRRGKLIDRGMPGVLAQTFRTLIHSRLATGIAAYEARYEGADILLFEPSREDYQMFFTNVFSFDSRKAVVEHAYHATLGSLAERRSVLAPVLAEHGLRLRDEVLDDPAPRLWAGVGLDLMEEPLQIDEDDRGTPVARTLRDVLARLDAVLDRAA